MTFKRRREGNGIRLLALIFMVQRLPCTAFRVFPLLYLITEDCFFLAMSLINSDSTVEKTQKNVKIRIVKLIVDRVTGAFMTF